MQGPGGDEASFFGARQNGEQRTHKRRRVEHDIARLQSRNPASQHHFPIGIKIQDPLINGWWSLINKPCLVWSGLVYAQTVACGEWVLALSLSLFLSLTLTYSLPHRLLLSCSLLSYFLFLFLLFQSLSLPLSTLLPLSTVRSLFLSVGVLSALSSEPPPLYYLDVHS